MKTFFWSKPSLARGIGVRMGLLAVAAILVLTIVSAQREREYSRVGLSRQAEIIVETTALSIRDELYSLKIDELRDLANKLDGNDEITLFIAYDKNGKILVDSRTKEMIFSQDVDPLGGELISLPADKTKFAWQANQLVAGQSVRIGDNVVGAIAIGFSTAGMEEKINDLTLQGIAIAFIFIVVSALLTFAMARQITMPLSELANAADEMKKGNLNIRANPRTTNDEIGKLSVIFNQMAEAIQEREQALRDQADGLEQTVNKRTFDLQEQARVLEQMAITDPLTQAFNRRQFYKLAEIEMKHARENGHPLSVIVMDADHFKRINDTYGHQAGDQALIKLTAICQDIIRDTDLFARYGGEEFVLLMPKTDIHAAKQVAERIRQKIEESEIKAEKRILRFTVSLGVSTFVGQHDLTFDSLLTQADRALYISKKMGRNRVTHWVEQTFQYN
jgi:diguanylate cyclase (GGDEF)-like protein